MSLLSVMPLKASLGQLFWTFSLTSDIFSSQSYMAFVFWHRISYDDFVANFVTVEICFLGPDTLAQRSVDQHHTYKSQWESSLFEGSWRSGENAGGCSIGMNCYSQVVSWNWVFTLLGKSAISPVTMALSVSVSVLQLFVQVVSYRLSKI